VTWIHACAHRELAGRSSEFCTVEAQAFFAPGNVSQDPEGQQPEIEGLWKLGSQIVRIVSSDDQPFVAHEVAQALRQRLGHRQLVGLRPALSDESPEERLTHLSAADELQPEAHARTLARPPGRSG